MSNWQWIETPDEGGQSGQTARKLMKGQLDPHAKLAREAIQNSWDAAQILKQRENHEFEISFIFKEFIGQAKKDFISNSSLKELQSRAKNIGYVNMGLLDDHCFENLDDANVPLRVLQVVDKGSHGLFGHPELKGNSHFFKAFYEIGRTDKASDNGGGGSFGFGKTALINASKVYVAYVYSCFEVLPKNESKNMEADLVTRRAMGWAWFDSHVGISRRNRNEECQGRAQLGDQVVMSANAVKVVPYEEDDADKFATSLGIEKRSANKINELGTTILLVDPSIDPIELVRNIEKYWWPALCDDLIHVSVVNYDGTELHPKPRVNPLLKPFIACYEIATKPNDVKPAGNFKLFTQTNGNTAVSAVNQITQSDSESHYDSLKPQIAFIRKPRMVVSYFDNFQTKRVPIRGVFVANDQADSLLRETEPAAHDQWNTNSDTTEISDAATATAKKVIDDVRKAVNEFAKELAPPAPDTRALPEFDKLFGKFFGSGTTVSPPPANPLPVHIEIKNQDLKEKNGEIFMEAKVILMLDENHKNLRMKIAFNPSLRILEDESRAGESIPLKIDPKTDKENWLFDNDQLIGNLERGKKYEFKIKSEPYDFLLSARLELDVTEK